MSSDMYRRAEKSRRRSEERLRASQARTKDLLRKHSIRSDSYLSEVSNTTADTINPPQGGGHEHNYDES